MFDKNIKIFAEFVFTTKIFLARDQKLCTRPLWEDEYDNQVLLFILWRSTEMSCGNYKIYSRK